MAGKRARRRLSDLEDPSLFAAADCLGSVTQLAKLTVLELLRTPCLSEDQISVFLISKFGLHKFDILRQAVSTVPLLFSTNRLEIIEELFPALKDVEDLPNAILLADHLSQSSGKDQRCFGPPTSRCLQGGGNLSRHNDPSDVVFFGFKGSFAGKKITLRCNKCRLNFSYSRFGNKESGYQFYDTIRDTVEATDSTLVDRELFELYCSLANHGWLSFEAFAEGYSEWMRRKEGCSQRELSAKCVADMFWWGELENSLRESGSPLKDFPMYKDADREQLMDGIEERRRVSTYIHNCTEDCKKRGCGKLWVIDGNWKLRFLHCMYKVKNAIPSLPMVNYPDICAATPEKGKAFCKTHCSNLSEQGIPTGLKEFLEYCSKQGGTNAPIVHDPDDSGENSEQVHFVDETVNKLQGSDLGLSSVSAQGLEEFTGFNKDLLPS
ncbi:uncharacterized protein LOC144633485 [Oculina patagonica]